MFEDVYHFDGMSQSIFSCEHLQNVYSGPDMQVFSKSIVWYHSSAVGIWHLNHWMAVASHTTTIEEPYSTATVV